MADMLNTALSAITSYQRALATTSHNIANVNTEGYSRQTVNLSSNFPQSIGVGAVGSGVSVSSVNRSFDQFVIDQMRSYSASYNQFESFSGLSSQIDKLLSDPATGISGALDGFFGSLQQLADSPASLPARQIVIAEANTLASRLSAVDSQLGQIGQEINTRVKVSIEEINGLTGQISELNASIKDFSSRNGGAEPNDLLDQRDQALFELSSYMNISVSRQDSGSVSVFGGGGQALVLDERSYELQATPSEYDPRRLEVSIVGAAGSVSISSRINGGTLGGALSFRDEVLDPSLAKIGQLSYGLASEINAQHQAGMDLNGERGVEFFTLPAPSVLASRNNTGSATPALTISDVGALSASNYTLQYDGSNFQLTDASSGAAVSMTGSGTVADPFQAEGLSIVIGGSPAAGDRFLLEPTARMAGELAVSISRPSDIAAAAATRASANTSNNGDLQITSSTVSDPDHPQLLTSTTIDFLSPTTYQINGSGSFSYSAGDSIVVNGTTVNLQGLAAAGDSLRIEANTGGSGDNRNSLALVDIQQKGLFEAGTGSISAAAGNLLSDVAVTARSAAINASSHQSLLAQNVAMRESVSGVNLEEEAANMLRYQQAFQAAAQAVSTSNSIFQTMLNAFS